MNRPPPTAAAARQAFLPVCRADMAARGWDQLDVLLVSGDAYVDHPAFGVPLLGRLLEARGYRVGILAQPDWRDPAAFTVMGRPRLCVALSAGAMDSLVNHYTAAGKKRRDDAYTPGGRAGARPNRALIAYTAAARAAFRQLPVLIGGIEASLRRLAHYDYWSDSVRRSLLIDSKADLLLYGMAENALLAVVEGLAAGATLTELRQLPGCAWVSSAPLAGVQLPSYEQVASDREAYGRAFALASRNAAALLVQPHGDRFVVVNPPAPPLTPAQLDALYALPFCRRPHPGYTEPIPAFEQIRWSITSHRGCQGGCAFCAIACHQGRRVLSRSSASILAEADQLRRDPAFRGTLSDVGGPTANMYGTTLRDARRCERCQRDSCLHPQLCDNLICDDGPAVALLRQLRRLEGVRHVFIASGVRFDLLERQSGYRQELFEHHIGGLLKVAPEALSDRVLQVMRKPPLRQFEAFVAAFRQHQRASGRRVGLVPYLMAGHPGCTLDDMIDTALVLKRLGLRVEQVQEFTPTPGTLATCIYHTGRDPLTGAVVFVERSARRRRLHKAVLLYHRPEEQAAIREALCLCGRQADGARLLGSAAPAGGCRDAAPAAAASDRAGRAGTPAGRGRRRTPRR
ncbi:YgiQ family radical SAM protein [Desulfuromonas thiophila]|uniref:YgiQ family radical SAM protein n=1 Tax=Desulfuromonas thiophila TaxID=57664 RepID=UPI0029F47CDB|nr:YgiQ family radical SAM protein [Desulfuromonas thiophila]